MEEMAMLVLSRKAGEEILIGGCIRVTVVGVNGNRVRIGIDAPRDLSINREEIHRRYLEFAEKLTSNDVSPV
jgi:carbon storage regulator